MRWKKTSKSQSQASVKAKNVLFLASLTLTINDIYHEPILLFISSNFKIRILISLPRWCRSRRLFWLKNLAKFWKVSIDLSIFLKCFFIWIIIYRHKLNEMIIQLGEKYAINVATNEFLLLKVNSNNTSIVSKS